MYFLNLALEDIKKKYKGIEEFHNKKYFIFILKFLINIAIVIFLYTLTENTAIK